MVNQHFGDPATLGELFRGELWRGRDNLRVSLRGPVDWRDLPSVVVPLLWLTSMLTALVALGLRSSGLVYLRGACFCALGLASGARAAGMIRRGGFPVGVRWAQALAVALVYDLARALSLVARATHRTRQAA